MSEQPSPPVPPRERGELAEEVFGFNLRSVRSLRDLIVAPRKIFASIIARDGLYTPMVRLWLALLGLQIAISVIWGGYGGMAERSLTASDPDSLAMVQSLTARPIGEVFSIYGNVMAVLHGPVVGGFTALAVFLLRGFGTRRAFATDLNLVFAVLTAGSIFGLTMLVVIAFVTLPSTLLFAVLFVVYALTFIRGATPELAGSPAGRLGKGAALSAALIALVFIGGSVAGGLSLLLALIWPL